MNEIVSYCGLVCNTCPIYLATRMEKKDDQTKKREEIARLCREQYGLNYEASNITDCDGCRTVSGRLFSGCIDCSIRNCAKDKQIENCAYCSKYVCSTLEAFFINDPSAKIRLNELRNKIL